MVSEPPPMFLQNLMKGWRALGGGGCSFIELETAAGEYEVRASGVQDSKCEPERWGRREDLGEIGVIFWVFWAYFILDQMFVRL